MKFSKGKQTNSKGQLPTTQSQVKGKHKKWTLQSAFEKAVPSIERRVDVTVIRWGTLSTGNCAHTYLSSMLGALVMQCALLSKER